MVDFNSIKDKWKARWKEQKLGEAIVDPKRPKFFLIWAYLTVSGFHHVGHMRGYSYADAICRYKRMQGFNVLLTAGGHASGNSAVAKAKKIAENDKETIDYYASMGLSDSQIHQLATPEGFVEFFSKKYIQDYDEYGFLGDWRRFTVTTYPDYNKFIEWQFKKLKENNLLVQKPYYATWCDSCGAVAVDPSESDLSKGGNAQKTEFTLIKLEYKPKQFLVVATLRPETMYGQTNIWMNPDHEYAILKVKDEQWIVSENCAQKLPHQMDNITKIGSIKATELIGKTVTAPFVEKKIPIFPAVFANPDIGTGIVTCVPSDAPADFVALRDLQNDAAQCTKFGLNISDVQAIKLIPIIHTKGFGEFPAKEIAEKLGIKNQADPKLAEATAEAYSKGFHTGVMRDNCTLVAGKKVEDAKKIMKEALVSKNLATTFYDLSEEVISRYGDRVYIKRVDGQWFIKYSDEKLTKDTVKHVESMNIQPDQFKQNLPGILNWFEDRACARQGRWLGTKLPFDQAYTIEPIADSTLYPIYYLVSLYVNNGQLKVEQLTEQFFDFVYLAKGTAADVAKKTGVSVQLIEQIRTDVEYWYPLDFNLGGKEHQTVHFPVYLMNHVGILPQKYYPKGIFVNWWVVAKGGKISKSKGGARSIADEANVYSVDAIRLFYANVASPFVDISFEPEDLQKYKNRLERIYECIENISTFSNQPHSQLDDWLVSQFNTKLKIIQQNMDAFEFKTVTDAIYFTFFNDVQWYLKRGGKNAQTLKPLLADWIKTMAAFTPFLAEELNEKIGNKSLVATAKFPTADDAKIKSNLSALEVLIENTNSDILRVKDLAKIQNPKQITLFVSKSWKYDFLKQLKERFAQTKDIGTLMKEFTAAFPQQKAEISALIPKILKNGVVPTVSNTLQEEFSTLQQSAQFLSAIHGGTVQVIKADESTHPKAAQATPGKAAIVVE
ncbi:MAG TPA: leucine--tRNA ligase [Acidobacteriota bacterium]|nr:leucine--tRNA ligase [Acidobacteriota bacterium]